jgi:hypothetical protein
LAQGAVDEGAGGLVLARDGVGADGAGDGDAVAGAGGCFFGCDAGDPEGQGCVAQVAGAAGERGGGEAGAECGGAGGVPGAAAGALPEDSAAGSGEQPTVRSCAEGAQVVVQEADKTGRDADGPSGAFGALFEAAVLVACAGGDPGGGDAGRGGVDDQQPPRGGQAVAAVAQRDGFLGPQCRQEQAPEERGQRRETSFRIASTWAGLTTVARSGPAAIRRAVIRPGCGHPRSTNPTAPAARQA